MIEIGPYRISAVETGTLRLDGGAMFGTVPRVLWEKEHPPDGRNRIRLAMRALLLEGEGRRILVDCGAGGKGDAVFRDRYGIDVNSANLEKSLGERGLGPEDVTDVFLTHLHFDHAGGATRDKAGGGETAAFPNATYYVQARNLETARRPNARERASYLPQTYRALLDEERLRLLDGAEQIFPCAEIYLSEGHTEAHQCLKVTDGKTVLFYGGDLLPTAAHLNLPWIAAYDLRPLTMLREKEEVLSAAAREGWIVFFEHDPGCAAVRVERTKKGFGVSGAVPL